MSKSLSLIPKRKLMFPDLGQEIEHIISHTAENIVTIIHSPPDRVIAVNDDQPVLTLTQWGSGESLRLRHATQPEIEFEEIDQTKPAGQYRFIVNADSMILQRAATADFATVTAPLTITNALLRIADSYTLDSDLLSIQPRATTVGNRILFKGIKSDSSAVTVAAITNHAGTPKFSIYRSVLQDTMDVNAQQVLDVRAMSFDGTSNFIRLGDYQSKPSAASTYRSDFLVERGAAGVADKLLICFKDNSDAYNWETVEVAGMVTYKSYFATTQGLGAGVTVYVAGFYEAPVADANLTQASTTITYGAANRSTAAHAFLVAGGAGSVDAGTVSIVVSGTSITDAGVRTTSDSETIVSDITAMSTDEYFETTKKWLGQITYTLTPSGATTYSADFNYGFAKYEDFGNEDFTITQFEAIGYAGANEDDFDILLCPHIATGWTYHATAFSPGTAAIAQLSTDHSTDDQLDSGQHFAYKRTNLSQAISGSGSEGFLVRIITTANNALEYANIHVGIKYT